MKKISLTVVLITALLLGPAAAFAHHSFAAEFDSNGPITLKGPITKVDFVNPHAWLYMNVTDPASGKVTNWAVEMGAPNTLIRRGFTKNTVPVGVEVTVTGFRAKDGSATCNGQTIKLPDGTQLFAGSNTTPGGAPAGERQ